MERYLSGDELAVADLVTDLETAVARGHFHPVLCVAPLTGVGVPELLDLLVAAFPCPKEHGCPPVTRPDGKRGRADERPRRAAGRRGGQDDHRPLPRPGLARPRLLGHPAAGHPDPRLRARHDRPRPSRPRRRRADRRRLLAAGSRAAPGRRVPGRRHLRRRPARQRRDRHAVLPGRPAPRPAVGPAHPAAADGGGGRLPRGRGPSRGRPGPPRGRGPHLRGSSAGPTPVSCCGARGRRTPRSSSSGCAAGTGSA